MPQFYTLEEAARVLGLSPEELKAKAQHREIRAFMDGGSWRFRVADIDEEARRRGMGSDPDLSLSDLEMPASGAPASDHEFDLSEFQLGVATPDLAPESIEIQPEPADLDVLLDDRSVPGALTGSSSTIIGMHPRSGKQPSDSDVRLVPDQVKGASDSDVRLGARLPSDSDVTLAGDESDPNRTGQPPTIVDPHATLAQPKVVPGSSRDLGLGSESDSDFELTPSSVLDALEPESGSDFELTTLDVSDEFEATPLRGPSDSDVTGAEPSTSGINLGRPSDSGINLQSVGGLDMGSADSIELAPLDEDDQPTQAAKPAPAKPTPGQPAKPAAKDKVDLSSTALPMKAEKDIFEDTDFEVDALDSGEASDDQTVQLEAASDFDLDENESASEVFAIDEEDVDQNASTAMAASPHGDQEEGGFAEEDGAEADSVWDVDEPATSSQAARAVASPMLGSMGATPEWGGLWVGLLAVACVFMMFLAFVGMDVVRNLYSFQGGGPASGLVKQIAGLISP